MAPHRAVALELAQKEAMDDPGADEALRITDEAVHTLLRFRGQHVTTARRAYAASAYHAGSGGYSPEALKVVADEERAAATDLHEARRRSDEQHGEHRKHGEHG